MWYFIFYTLFTFIFNYVTKCHLKKLFLSYARFLKAIICSWLQLLNLCITHLWLKISHHVFFSISLFFPSHWMLLFVKSFDCLNYILLSLQLKEQVHVILFKYNSISCKLMLSTEGTNILTRFLYIFDTCYVVWSLNN